MYICQHGACMEVRGQLLRTRSLLLPYDVMGHLTHVVRFVLSHGSIFLAFLALFIDLYVCPFMHLQVCP